jgi:hypothetical protein
MPACTILFMAKMLSNCFLYGDHSADTFTRWTFGSWRWTFGSSSERVRRRRSAASVKLLGHLGRRWVVCVGWMTQRGELENMGRGVRLGHLGHVFYLIL